MTEPMTPFQTLIAETAEAQQHLLRAPILADLAMGAFDLAAYRVFLTNAYHHVRHTVPLMMACASRLPERLEWLLPALIDYVNEEKGHERWILQDLEACGVDAESVRTSAPGFEVEMLVSYVYDYIERHNPVGFLGMVHVLEGTSTAIATGAAEIIQNTLGLPDAAFSYLRSHGALDIEHVAFFERLVNRTQSADDLAAIVHVARRVYRLYGDVIRAVPRLEQRHAA